MKLQRMMNLFLEYQHTKYLLEKIEKDLQYFSNQKIIKNTKRYEKTIKVKSKLTEKIQVIKDKWGDITEEKIEDFVSVYQKEIEEYYNNPKRKDLYNPFKKYYV